MSSNEDMLDAPDAPHPPPPLVASNNESAAASIAFDLPSTSSSSNGENVLHRDSSSGGEQNVVDMETSDSGISSSDPSGSGSERGPGPVNLGMADDIDDDDEIEDDEDVEDYREDLLNIDGADSHDDSDGASSNDDNEGGSDADLGAEEDELEDPEDTGEFNKPKEGEALIGCKHYRRRCALICFTCQKPFTCRFCHDEVEFNHELDRKSVVEIQCLECDRRQPVASHCLGCKIQFALYFCSICRLYDDEDKNQYHCEGCKICRIGGRENFFHCQTCDMCLAISMRDNHKCIEKMSRSNCPVCLEDLHTSRKACRVPKCGHMLHFKCMQQLLKTGNYACPTCSVSMVDMSTVWERLDYEVNLTPMPTEYRDLKVAVLCRDCHHESKSSFHVLGQKCKQCGSYNTCRTADAGVSCCGDEPAQEAREHQQAEAEDAAAAAVRELGLAANMRPEDDDDDAGDNDDENDDHYRRIRGLIHSLATAASSQGGDLAAGPSNSRGGGGGSGGSAGEESSGASSNSPEVASGSGDGPSGAAAAMAPLYRDFEDDDLD